MSHLCTIQYYSGKTAGQSWKGGSDKLGLCFVMGGDDGHSHTFTFLFCVSNLLCGGGNELMKWRVSTMMLGTSLTQQSQWLYSLHLYDKICQEKSIKFHDQNSDHNKNHK